MAAPNIFSGASAFLPSQTRTFVKRLYRLLDRLGVVCVCRCPLRDHPAGQRYACCNCTCHHYRPRMTLAFAAPEIAAPQIGVQPEVPVEPDDTVKPC